MESIARARETWSSEYKVLVNDFKETLVENSAPYFDYIKRHGTKIPLEGFDDSRMQSGWVSRLGKRPELKHFSQQYIRVHWENIRKYYFKNWQNEIDELVEAKPELLTKIQELETIYYCAEPRTHYPFL